MCGNTFKMNEIEVTKGYGNFSNMATWPIHVNMAYPCWQSLKS